MFAKILGWVRWTSNVRHGWGTSDWSLLYQPDPMGLMTRWHRTCTFECQIFHQDGGILEIRCRHNFQLTHSVNFWQNVKKIQCIQLIFKENMMILWDVTRWVEIYWSWIKLVFVQFVKIILYFEDWPIKSFFQFRWMKERILWLPKIEKLSNLPPCPLHLSFRIRCCCLSHIIITVSVCLLVFGPPLFF